MKKKFVQGLIKRHPDGFGFLVADDPEQADVYIPHHGMNGAMSNDRVLAEVSPEKGGDRFRGEIVRIVQRGTKKIVGHFSWLNDSQGVVRDESHGWGQDLRVSRENGMRAKNGDLVVAEITSYPEQGERFTGRIIEIIGDIEDPMNDIRRIIHGHNLPHQFPPEALKEAERFGPVPEQKDMEGRRDLRGKKLITIDGATAKDFDDAVLVETTDKGFRLFVAIADVSHYVRPETAIDKEAYVRGTSVYFPNFVIPMLPEELSNGLCSLNPHVPRLCVVAEMLFDYTGAKISSEFYEAVMESKARVTYGQAQEMIDGTELPPFEHVRETVLRCADLAKLLMAKRFREGSLDLEIPETQLQIDGAGRPVDVIRSERLFAHRLIEELMLAANVAVAEFLSGRDVPALYRVHEPPNDISLKLLERYLTSFGSRTKLEGGRLQKRLTRALEEFAGKPEAQVLHILTLRSMSQAKYSPTNLGHFGLGFDNYSHFTSPIRRYPDLVIHRLLKNQIMPKSSYRLMSQDDLSTAGAWLSACEQRSVKAERNLMSIKKARFMQPMVGREFEGFVSSVARFGAFVLLREYDIDGLVRTDDLGDGRWEYDEERLQLVARSSGRSIGLGDSMKIVVAAADPSTGQVTFVPSESLARKSHGGGQHARPRHESERRGSTQDRRGSERGRREKDRPQKTGAPAAASGREATGKKAEAGHAGARLSFKDRLKNRFMKRKGEDVAPARSPDRHAKSKGRHEKPRDGDSRSAPRATTPKAGATERFDRGAIQSSARSRKLQFADRTKVGLNKRDETPHEGSRSAGRNSPESSRKDAAKRGSPENDRGGVRETRVPQRGGKSSPGKVSRRKAQRQRRD